MGKDIERKHKKYRIMFIRPNSTKLVVLV